MPFVNRSGSLIHGAAMGADTALSLPVALVKLNLYKGPFYYSSLKSLCSSPSPSTASQQVTDTSQVPLLAERVLSSDRVS